MNATQTILHQELNDQNVLLLGLGRQGGAKVANRLVELGAKVRVSDQLSENVLAEVIKDLSPSIELHLGSHDQADVAWADLIVKNPAVPYTHPLILAAEQAGIPVTSEAALAMKHVRDRVIGVTGTRGKTTTSHLIWHILHQAGKKVHLGGNIPQQPTLETVLQAGDEDWFVLELSSFQLETLGREQLSPHIAVLTSFSHDHLNRYKTMDEYLEAKEHIFRWQQPHDAAFWIEQPEWQDHIMASIPHDVTKTSLNSQDIRIQMHATPTALPGEHNQQNAALAATVSRYLGVEHDVIKRAIASFTGVPYRQQVIPTQDGLTWINDTTATTPTALLTALKTHEKNEIILLAGGTTKDLPFPDELLKKLQNLTGQTIWLKGSGTQELLTKLGAPNTPTYNSLREAVESARSKAQELSIKTILFSPGFSSFELFKNEFDRGDQFNALVQKVSLNL